MEVTYSPSSSVFAFSEKSNNPAKVPYKMWFSPLKEAKVGREPEGFKAILSLKTQTNSVLPISVKEKNKKLNGNKKEYFRFRQTAGMRIKLTRDPIETFDSEDRGSRDWKGPSASRAVNDPFSNQKRKI